MTDLTASRASGIGRLLPQKLQGKLVLQMVGLALAMMIGLIAMSAISAGSKLRDLVARELASVAEARAAAIGIWIDSVENDLHVTAQSPAVSKAVRKFSVAWHLLEQRTGRSQLQELQRLYITENPHPTGQKDALMKADDGSVYSTVHGEYHPFFHELQVRGGYYDIFLFDTDGNLVYSVFKELDYATNMRTGVWKDTDLAAAFVAANTLPDGQHVFFDFAPYGPSADAPASFIATPLFDEVGERIGVLAFQMPVDRINEIMAPDSAATSRQPDSCVGSKLRRNQAP